MIDLFENQRRRIVFRVIGVAQPKGSTKSFVVETAVGPRTATTSDNPRLKDWQHLVASAAQPFAGDLFTGPVFVRASFFLPRPKSLPRKVSYHLKKPDLDKLLRATKDALTGVLYRDDSQVVSLSGFKAYALNAPFVDIELEG